MKKLLFAVALTGLLASCGKEDSSDVNQDKIYTIYEMSYNANTDKTAAIARLRFGTPTGTLLDATEPAGVTFNGEELPYNIFYGGHAKEYPGKLTGGTFVYTNVEGESFTNTTPSMGTIDYPETFTTVTKSEVNTMAWVGDPLAKNERAHMFVGTWTWKQDALFSSFTEGDTELTLGLVQLKPLAAGNSTVYLDRINEVAVEEGTSEGGVIRTRYRTKNKTIEIVE